MTTSLKRIQIGHRNILKGTTCKLNFSKWIRGHGPSIFPIETINILSLRRKRDSDFNLFFVIMKKEK